MSPLMVLLGLVRFSPAYFALCVLYAVFIYVCLPIPLGLATRAFFDALADQPAGLNAWSAIALLVAVQVGEVLADPVLRNPWSAVQQKSHALLRRNLFAGILRGYGRHGLPASIGETISRFRDDPEGIADALDALCDLIGRTLFAAVAVVVMWQIDPTITAALFVPLLLCSCLTEALGRKIMAYRAASHAATGRLDRLPGELIGAQLALKVGRGGPQRGRPAGGAGRRAPAGGGARHRLQPGARIAQPQPRPPRHRPGAAARGPRDPAGHVHGGRLRPVRGLPRPAHLVPGRDRPPDQRPEADRGLVRPDAGARAGRAAGGAGRTGPRSTCAATRRSRHPRRRASASSASTCAGSPTPTRTARAASSTSRSPSSAARSRSSPAGSAAGKTTLLHALLGLLPRDAGEVRWNGRPVDDPGAFFVPPRSAYTPQVPRLFSETLRENLLLGWPDDPAALDRAVRAAVLEPDLAALERGLDTLVGPRGVKLSGGQIQRTAAARMFVRDAELLVFDDLSSALDAETEAELWRRLFARGRDATCLVVSHRPAALRRADQVLLMEAGQIVALGTLSELITSSAEMQRLWQDERGSRETASAGGSPTSGPDSPGEEVAGAS